MNHDESKNLWISLGAGLLGMFLLYSYTQEKSKILTKNFGVQSNVLIATRDISEMETIDETMVDIIEIPSAYKQPNAVKNPDLAVGKVALAPITKGEQILKNKMLAPGPVTGLSLQVQPGMRALTLPVDDVRGVAKLVKPGDRIDLIAALDVGSGFNRKRQVRTMLQDIPILATGLRISNELPRVFEQVGEDNFVRNLRSDTDFNTITIEVSPREAQDLIYILSTSPSTLFLTLRHPSDRKKENVLAASLDKLTKTRAPASVKPSTPKPKPRTRRPKPKPKRKRPFVDL